MAKRVEIDHEVLIGILAEFFVNLGAGWFGVVVITSVFSPPWYDWVNLMVLTRHLVSAILSLVIAYQLRMILKGLRS